ncbi:hypothetical protein [Sediminitomix flava]|uniref:Uncharacterized protein n=1 Tax=Sediminitomix flava TaxID=379075 RepID=A0A315Z6T8_SEDFL|nr:hypothetical protein [Sediminitomix flava]PWJ40107.1 hypothetical protein BC781_105170 [Sediminitomix flava]
MVSKDQENCYVLEFWEDDIEEGLEDKKEFGLLLRDFSFEYRLMKELLTKVEYPNLAEDILDKYQKKDFKIVSSYDMGNRISFTITI